MPNGRTNFLLRNLAPGDADLLADRLEPIDLPLRFSMERPLVPIRHAYFLDAGVASIVSLAPRGRRIEAGIFGREGMSATAVLLGSDRSPNETYIQIAGHGRRITVEALNASMDESATLRPLFLRYIQTLIIQTAHTALANGRARLEERLARWLLMCHDRLDSDELPITHEFLSLMLGVRRAGVTVALRALDMKGLIRTHRGGSVVLDRNGLETLAKGLHGVPEAEYRRLLG